MIITFEQDLDIQQKNAQINRTNHFLREELFLCQRTSKN